MTAQLVEGAADLDRGEALATKLTAGDGSEVRVAVFHDEDGNWFATEEMCPHADVSLAEGDVGSCEVECWAHSATFNLKTGEATLPSPRPIKTYKIVIEGGDVLVDVDA